MNTQHHREHLDNLGTHGCTVVQHCCCTAACSCTLSYFCPKVRKETKHVKGRKQRQRCAARRLLGKGDLRLPWCCTGGLRQGQPELFYPCFQFRRFTTLFFLIPFSTIKEHKAPKCLLPSKRQRNATIQNPSQSASGLG